MQSAESAFAKIRSAGLKDKGDNWGTLTSTQAGSYSGGEATEIYLMKIFPLMVLVLSSLLANGAELLRGNFWPNPSFEQGVDLGLPSGTPTGWQRGGSATEFCQVMIAGSATNHALAVVDSDNRY